MAGIKGIVVNSKKKILYILEKLQKDKEIGIILLTEEVVMLISDKVKEIKNSKYGPLIVEIPSVKGSTEEKDLIMKYIKDSIGLKI